MKEWKRARNERMREWKDKRNDRMKQWEDGRRAQWEYERIQECEND